MPSRRVDEEFLCSPEWYDFNVNRDDLEEIIFYDVNRNELKRMMVDSIVYTLQAKINREGIIRGNLD